MRMSSGRAVIATAPYRWRSTSAPARLRERLRRPRVRSTRPSIVRGSLGARLMIHSPMASPRGNPEQISTALNVLKELEAEMAVAYAEKSNLTPLEILKLMRAETWFTLREAQQIFRGIEADDMKVAASIKPEWLERFTNIPLDVAVGLHVAAGACRRPLDPRPGPWQYRRWAWRTGSGRGGASCVSWSCRLAELGPRRSSALWRWLLTGR